MLSLEDALSLIKPEYAKKCKVSWLTFVDFSGSSFDQQPPEEEILIDFFKFLRSEKHCASSSLWVFYSHMNVVMKNWYSLKLQSFPRITTLLKSFDSDIKRKAGVFESSDIQTFIESTKNVPYWKVRKVVIILAYFGGLRHIELMDLKLEKIVQNEGGILVTHARAK